MVSTITASIIDLIGLWYFFRERFIFFYKSSAAGIMRPFSSSSSFSN